MIPTRQTIKTNQREPGKDGNYRVNIQLILTPELYDFLYTRAGIEKRSPTNITVRALEAYKIKTERLGV